MNLHEFLSYARWYFLPDLWMRLLEEEADFIAGYMFAGFRYTMQLQRINYHRQRERRCQHGIL